MDPIEEREEDVEMKPTKLKLEIEVDEARLAALLCEGFEGGIGYWAAIQDYRVPTGEVAAPWGPEDKLLPRYITYPLSPGGAVVLVDLIVEKEEHKRHTHVLDREAVVRGLRVMQQKYPRHFANWLSENDDSETGDVFIQCAVLGDIVYG